MKYWPRWKWLLSISGLLVLSACYTSVRMHPDFSNARRKIGTIALLPMEVSQVQLRLDGDNRRMPDKEHQITKLIRDELATTMEKRGYSLVDSNIDSLSKEKADIRFGLYLLKQDYYHATGELYANQVSPQSADTFRVDIGPVVNQFADRAQSDALLLVSYSGYEESSGLIAKDIAGAILMGAVLGVVPTKATSSATLQAALIDGTTGDILWTNIASGQYKASQLVTTVFSKMPDIQGKLIN